MARDRKRPRRSRPTPRPGDPYPRPDREDDRSPAPLGEGEPMSAASAFGDESAASAFGAEGVATAPPRGASPRGIGRVTAFLRASWAELQRVEWPDRRQVAQATGVVLGFVILAALYLGLADTVSQSIVNAIL